MIHGIENGLGWLGSLQRTLDWTEGCIAVTDAEIDEIYAAVPDGTQSKFGDRQVDRDVTH